MFGSEEWESNLFMEFGLAGFSPTWILKNEGRHVGIEQKDRESCMKIFERIVL